MSFIMPQGEKERKEWFDFFMKVSPSANLMTRRVTYEDVTKDELMSLFLFQSATIDGMRVEKHKAIDGANLVAMLQEAVKDPNFTLIVSTPDGPRELVLRPLKL